VDLEIWLGVPREGELIADDRVHFYSSHDGEVWLQWVWDTTGLVGPQMISVVLDPDDEMQIGDEDPDNNLVVRTIDLQPRAELPTLWDGARWIKRESACCAFHFISGSAAARDIEQLMAVADEAIAFVGEQLGEEMGDDKLGVYLINRVLAHGGFASDAIVISYLDRFYAGGELAQVFRHEGIHVLDRRFAQIRPTLLGEGLAVYLSGGHYQKEPIAERAAALLSLDLYIPLSDLVNDFYPSQHEIGYLEAAGFVGFLIDRFGWDAFKTFYSDIQSDQASQADMIDAALQKHFGLTLSEAEADWLATLRALTPPPTEVTDLRLTIDFYETMRRYQRDWDPSAYYLGVWLPSLKEAERRGVTADFTRRPTGVVNITLEAMFIAADRALDAGAYALANELLAAINTVLDADGDVETNPLAAEYMSLVRATAQAGYQAQQVELDGAVARVLTTIEDGADTVELTFARRAGAWHLVASSLQQKRLVR
jgi:hypothetical protein